MSPYLGELAGVMAVFSFAIVAPGADTAMVMRQSLVHGRRAGILTAFGVGTSLLFHLTYTILGLGLIVSQSLLLFSVIKWAGAAYLTYMGIMALRAPAPTLPEPGTQVAVPMGNLRAFGLGFLTNALNPKTTLFVVSTYTQLVSPGTPLSWQFGYGLFMSFAHWIWFGAVAWSVSSPILRRVLLDHQLAADRVVGAVLMALGAALAAAQL